VTQHRKRDDSSDNAAPAAPAPNPKEVEQ